MTDAAARRAPVAGTLIPAASAALAGCTPNHSALDVHGADARAILDLFGIFLGVSAAVWILVMVALAVGLLRHRPATALRPDPIATDRRHERLAARAVGTAVAATAAILVALTVLSYLTDKTLAGARGHETLTIRVTGHQWWWDVTYQDAQPARWLTTANEIHIPVGEPVKLELEADDVIHSFWVPSLAGKKDLIPGQQNELYLEADRPGEYRGQCAEFCGLQHAHMGVRVVAEPRSAFDAWREAQLAPAASPGDPERERGRHVFLTKGCMMCHTIRGTSAGGKVAPDLTHVASRATIAAGALPLTRGSLAAWIADPQAIKPGTNMPRVDLDPDELNALVSYLEGLK